MNSPQAPAPVSSQASAHRPLIAALLSAFVFPGAGLWYLGYFTYSLIFAVPTVFALIYIARGVWQASLATVEPFAERYIEQILMTDNWDADWLELIANLRGQIYALDEVQQSLWILGCAWALSIAASFIVGTRQTR